MKKKRLKKYLQRLLKANLNLQRSLNLKKNDRDFWKCKADEYAQLHNKTLAERDEWKDAANKNMKLVKDAVNVLDLCFGVMMQPCIHPQTHILGINVNVDEWKEAREMAEKMYYELKNALKKNDLNETGSHFQDSFRYAMTALKPEIPAHILKKEGL